MGRRDFFPVEIPVMELLLDPKNARIRSGKDQAECISRILRKEDQLVALAKDIAANGLSTAPILVFKNPADKWVVMDGNRRITAMKLLLNPDLCPIEKVRKQLTAIRTQYSANIVDTVDCLASDDFDVIINEILLRHSGALGGVGQLDWTTYWRTAFMLQHQQADPNRRVGQYLLWAEERGIQIDDSFPVTNLTRFINEANLRLLGFKIEGDVLVPILHEDMCKKMASKIIADFGPGQKSVNSVYSPEQQRDYLKEVLAAAGIKGSEAKEAEAGGTKGGAAEGDAKGGTRGEADRRENPDRRDTGDDGEPKDRRQDGGGASDGGGETGRGGSRPKASWDRPKLFPRGMFPGTLPADASKARDVVADLCKLETGKTTLAVAVLLRVLIEMSNAYYRDKNGLKESDGLRGGVLDSARKMYAEEKLTKDQFDVIERRAKTENDMLNINTLQAFVHKSTFHPDRQALHTFWDDVRWFVVACWAP